jgi:hypothetical protein
MFLPKYLDAGTGSAIWAALTSGLAGVIVIIKIFWYRITKQVSRFVKSFGKKK